MKKKFKDYTNFDAFLSGIYCTWPSLIFYGIIIIISFICKFQNSKIDLIIFAMVIFINILTPIMCYLIDKYITKLDIYTCHEILYIFGEFYALYITV